MAVIVNELNGEAFSVGRIISKVSQSVDPLNIVELQIEDGAFSEKYGALNPTVLPLLTTNDCLVLIAK